MSPSLMRALGKCRRTSATACVCHLDAEGSLDAWCHHVERVGVAVENRGQRGSGAPDHSSGIRDRQLRGSTTSVLTNAPGCGRFSIRMVVLLNWWSLNQRRQSPQSARRWPSVGCDMSGSSRPCGCRVGPTRFGRSYWLREPGDGRAPAPKACGLDDLTRLLVVGKLCQYPEIVMLFLLPFTLLGLSLTLAHVLGILQIPKPRGFLFLPPGFSSFPYLVFFRLKLLDLFFCL